MAPEPAWAKPIRVLLSGPLSGEVGSGLEGRRDLELVRRSDLDGSRHSVGGFDVVLHSTTEGGTVQSELDKLRSVTRSPVILATSGDVNGLLDEALQAGVADFLVLPQPPETILFAIRKAVSTPRGGPGGVGQGRIVTVVSPKGGTGKTVVSTNLAASLARAGQRSLVVDLDLQFGDAAIMLGVESKRTIVELASQGSQLDAEKLAAFAVVDSRTGVALLPGSDRPEESEAIRDHELAIVLSTARVAFDAVIVDTAPLFDRAMLAALDASDEVILVSNPELPSLKNTQICLDTLDRLGIGRERLTMVVNRIGSPNALGRSDIEHALDTDIDYTLPDDSAVPDAINRAVPVIAAYPNSRFSEAMLAFAATLGGDRVSPAQARRRFRIRGAK